MVDENQTQTPDIDDEDETSAFIRNLLEDMPEDTDGEAGGLDQPIKEPDAKDFDVVSAEQGMDIMSDAEFPDKTKAKPAKSDEPREPATDKGDDTTPSAHSDDDTTNDLSSAALPDLLKGMNEASRAEVTRRLDESAAVMKHLQTPHIAEQMKAHGADPAAVVSRLTDLATFAAEKTDEYVAWVIDQFADPEQSLEAWNKAAAHHGFKVINADDDGDENDIFDDPEVRAIKEENARLKRELQGEGPGYGPDAPQRVSARTVQQQLTDLRQETDERGALKRPYFDTLQPQIVALSQAHVQQTGQPATIEDVARFYDQAVADMQAMFAPARTPSAAQQRADMADQTQKNAAAAGKAAAASTSIDGTGQSVNRRPAIPADAPVVDVIGALWDQMSG